MTENTQSEDGVGMAIKVAAALSLLVLGLVGWRAFANPAAREEPVFVELPSESAPAAMGFVRGVAVDEAGAPLAGLTLGWRTASDDSLSAPTNTSELKGGEIEAVTTADGTFEIGPLRPGDGRIEVLAHRGVATPILREGTTGWIEVQEGQAATGIRLVATPVPSNRVLGGRVVDAAGQPVPGLHMQLHGDGGLFGASYLRHQPTSSDGRFLFIAPTSSGSVRLEWPFKAGGTGSWRLDKLGSRVLHVSLQ